MFSHILSRCFLAIEIDSDDDLDDIKYETIPIEEFEDDDDEVSNGDAEEDLERAVRNVSELGLIDGKEKHI